MLDKDNRFKDDHKEINQPGTDDTVDPEKGDGADDQRWYVPDTEDNRPAEYDFSDLDYEPPKKGIILPGLIITFVVVLMAGLIVFLGMRQDPEVDVAIELPEDPPAEDEAEEPDPDAFDPFRDAQNRETDQEEPEEAFEEEEELPPDYELLEDALHDWLIERINDPEVLMFHLDSLEEAEDFMGRHGPEDNVIIYEIEEITDDGVSVLFGLPFREASIRAVFGWHGNEWVFLREESFY